MKELTAVENAVGSLDGIDQCSGLCEEGGFLDILLWCKDMPYTVPAEKSLSLNLSWFGFDWVATEFKFSLIASYNI